MVRVIVTVLVVLIIIAYGAMFLSWNQQAVPVTGFAWSGQGWVEDVPLGMVILGGVLVGALIMAAFAFSAWQAQYSRGKAAQAKVALAKKKLDELVAKIKQQREKIAQLEQELRAQKPPPEGAGEPEKPEAMGEDEEEI
jgi:uncharacterized integral membrane protein